MTRHMSTREAAHAALDAIGHTVHASHRHARDQGDTLDALEWLGQIEATTKQNRRALVNQLRAMDTPWQTIADALGVSRQAAQQQYGAPKARRTGRPADAEQITIEEIL